MKDAGNILDIVHWICRQAWPFLSQIGPGKHDYHELCDDDNEDEDDDPDKHDHYDDNALR